jgi:hypothetical protein
MFSVVLENDPNTSPQHTEYILDPNVNAGDRNILATIKLNPPANAAIGPISLRLKATLQAYSGVTQSTPFHVHISDCISNIVYDGA